ncbi:MAG: hypothetical protein F6K14_26365 [Symploca sp. SIO2C1]|nr:hypothetical protein [Symploca sp. SIO2C1]
MPYSLVLEDLPTIFTYLAIILAREKCLSKRYTFRITYSIKYHQFVDYFFDNY